MNDTCAPFRVPSSEIDLRVRSLQAELKDTRIPAILIIQRVDLFYLSGTAQNSVLFVPAEGKPLLMVRKYYPRAKDESPLRNIIEIRSIKEITGLISDFFGKTPETMGLELDVMPVNSYLFYKRLFPETRLVDASPAILKVRARKSQWEIEQMEKTALLSQKVFLHLGEIIRPGISEIDLAADTESFARKKGHAGKLRVRDFQTEGYFWHILGGKSGGMLGLLDAPASGEGTSAAFPCGAGIRPIQVGEPVMADLGVVLNGYHLDETRMFSIGAMNEKARNAAEAAIEIHDRIIENMRPGASSGELFKFSLGVAADLGYGENYLGPPDYRVQFVAHGIGLELIEPPFIASGKEDILMPGMIFALEPKIVFPGEFIAGIESVVLVTDSGPRMISKVPTKVFIC